jgi:hypothetical protein
MKSRPFDHLVGATEHIEREREAEGSCLIDRRLMSSSGTLSKQSRQLFNITPNCRGG